MPGLGEAGVLADGAVDAVHQTSDHLVRDDDAIGSGQQLGHPLAPVRPAQLAQEAAAENGAAAAAKMPVCQRLAAHALNHL